VGYVATRALGQQRGTAVTGLSGGLVSSTAVTLAFAKQSREERGKADDALTGGLLLAWAVMGVRIVIIAAFVFAPLVGPLLPPVGALTAVTLGTSALFLRRARAQAPAAAGEVALKNPFSLTSAAKFGLLFAAVLLVVAAVERYLPGRGYYLVAALAGLTDVDAITLSMAELAREGLDAKVAATAILLAAMSNTVVKAIMALSSGGWEFGKRTMIGFGAMLIAGGAGLGLLWVS
jgi:uncharacterized membrane protein (DUF4010 family)